MSTKFVDEPERRSGSATASLRPNVRFWAILDGLLYYTGPMSAAPALPVAPPQSLRNLSIRLHLLMFAKPPICGSSHTISPSVVGFASDRDCSATSSVTGQRH